MCQPIFLQCELSGTPTSSDESYLHSTAHQRYGGKEDGGWRAWKNSRDMRFSWVSQPSRECVRETDPLSYSLFAARKPVWDDTRLYYLLISVRSPPLPPLLDGKMLKRSLNTPISERLWYSTEHWMSIARENVQPYPLDELMTPFGVWSSTFQQWDIPSSLDIANHFICLARAGAKRVKYLYRERWGPVQPTRIKFIFVLFWVLETSVSKILKQSCV